MFIFANSIEIYYSTAVECPAENAQSYGAQIDLKSFQIFSSYINSTKGKSTYCCAVQFRNANDGNFKYQTFVDLTGGYLTSFTHLNHHKNKLDISFCNYVNNTIVKPEQTVGSFIYMENCDVSISNFCFVGIKIPDNRADFEFVLIIEQPSDKHTIILSNSFIENNIRDYLDGQCEGNLSPPPTIFSSTFTPTSHFSKSCEFSHSDKFGASGRFTSSNILIKIYPSDIFTASKPFSSSDLFNPSSHFSDSKEFSESFEFTHSKMSFVDRDANIGSSNKGGKVAIIASVAAATTAGIIAAVVIFFIIKKRKKLPTSDIDLIDQNNSSITIDNKLKSVMDEDDPFATDF